MSGAGGGAGTAEAATCFAGTAATADGFEEAPEAAPETWEVGGEADAVDDTHPPILLM